MPGDNSELRDWRGDATLSKGTQIQDMVDGMYRQYIDVGVKAGFDSRDYGVCNHVMANVSAVSASATRTMNTSYTEGVIERLPHQRAG